jgi:hypothetical protein
MRALFFFLLLTCSVHSQAPNDKLVGHIKKIKGLVQKIEQDKKILLIVGGEISEGELIVTGANSYTHILFPDQTSLHVGPESELLIKKLVRKDGLRDHVFSLLKGKLRGQVLERTKDGEKIVTETKEASIAIRGTEYLSNAYIADAQSMSDVYLLKGHVEVTTLDGGKLTLTPGQAINSQQLKTKGPSAVKLIDRELLEKLAANPEEFAPELHAEGQVRNDKGQGSSIGVSTPPLIAPTMAVSLAATSTQVALAPSKNKETKDKKKSHLQGVLEFNYQLEKEPWDIRDAVMNSKKNRAQGKCFYFFYKKIPGGGDDERFRRERDCSEFDYEL